MLIQALADGSEQSVGRARVGEEAGARAAEKAGVAASHFTAVTAHKDDAEFALILPQPGGQVASVQLAGHNQVGEEQMDLRGMARPKLKRRLGAAGLTNLIADVL